MPPLAADLIIAASWVLPMEPGAAADSTGPETAAADHTGHRGAIPDGAVAISGGRIVGIGPAAQIRKSYSAGTMVSLDTHVLLPGLVNAHGHAAMTLFRGYCEDAPLQSWLTEQIWPLEARWVDETFIRDGSRLAIAEMIKAGITCFSDMYFFPEITAREARQAGVRAQITFPIIEFPNAWTGGSEEAFHKGLALHDEYRHDPHVDVAFGPHSVYAVSSEDLDRILMYSEELDANVHIHLHENPEELAETKRKHGTTGISLLHERGLLGPRLQAVHVTQIEPEQIALFAESNVQVIHCPTSNAKLASGIAPITALHAAGVSVGLGTDGAASNDLLDVLGEARLASLLAKLDQNDAAALPATTALEMATCRGAAALGRADQLGSLSVGKVADLIAVNVAALRHHPLYDPVAQLLHTGGGSSVSHVWVDGECLLNEGRLTRMDEEEIRSRTLEWRQRIMPP